MAAENQTKPKPNSGDEIPFVKDAEIATGLQERIDLFARLATEGKYVPRDWLLTKLGIQKQTLSSTVRRISGGIYYMQSAKTKDGMSVVKITKGKP